MSGSSSPSWTVPYSCPAVTTKEAKDSATTEVTAELTILCPKILAITDRDERTTKFVELRANTSEATRKFLDLTRLREVQHKDFMEYLLTNHVSQFGGDVMKNRKNHDYSKDELFFFAAPAFFDGGVKTPEMEKFKTDELNRHYELEAHHPEFENYHERECSKLDIQEMAIDRMARNVQFGDGIINMEVLMKFLPKFPKGDNEAKQAIFRQTCDEYKVMVQREFGVMFPDTKNWSKSG